MASTKSTVRKLKVKHQLTREEIKRLAEKLGVALDHDSEDTALLLLLFDHIREVYENHGDLYDVIYIVRTHLFINTDESEAAKQKFQDDAFANRGKLLQWPYEREGKK